MYELENIKSLNRFDNYCKACDTIIGMNSSNTSIKVKEALDYLLEQQKVTENDSHTERLIKKLNQIKDETVEEFIGATYYIDHFE